MTERREVQATISGMTLTDADVMTLRLAVEALAEQMAYKGALGRDAHGEAMRLGYLDAARKVRDMLLRAES
jgi:hypothetical protein